MKEKKKFYDETMKRKLLLHICCASCGLYVFDQLKDFYEVTGFFYNPNIHPFNEYINRRDEVLRISNQYQWHVEIPDYDMEKWFSFVKGMTKEPERGKRCLLCFDFRLRKTFEYANTQGFEIVASTLSISPYKNTNQINQVGLKLAVEYQLEFLPENFKKNNGYPAAKQMAMAHGIIHQHYCGCVYSKADYLIRSRKTNSNSS
jgi:predicted adenine nucleotide alpha hydrolase (AANH) superfamily ATPase